MTKTTKAKIVKKVKMADDVVHFDIELSDSFRNSFTIAGQYAVISLEGDKSYFALASSPNQNRWSFLIKSSSPLTAHLISLNEGDAIEVSKAQGKGYDLDKLKAKDCMLFAVGTGIAPIRSAIQTLLDDRSHYQDISLYYGVKQPNQFYYADEFAHWSARGLKLIQVVSNQDDANWQGLKGHVQDHLPSTIATDQLGVLVCGMKEMIDAITNKLTHQGLAPEFILTNY